MRYKRVENCWTISSYRLLGNRTLLDLVGSRDPFHYALGEAGSLTRLTLCEIIESNGPTERRMAGNLHVRNLEDDMIARLKCRAARHGRSTEAEYR